MFQINNTGNPGNIIVLTGHVSSGFTNMLRQTGSVLTGLRCPTSWNGLF